MALARNRRTSEEPQWNIAELAGCAVAQHGELLVLPSFSVGGSSGVLCDSAEIDDICDIAERAGIAILLVYRESCSTGRYSAAQLIAADGRALANYRCTHADSERSDRLDDGHWLSIVPYGGRRIGLLLDGDIRAPEVSRALVLGGADLLLHVARTVYLGAELAKVRAWENHCVVLSVCDETAFAFGSKGQELSQIATQADLVFVDLPPLEPGNSVARRPELYAQIALNYDDR